MSKRILVLQGHPDADAPRLCHALEEAYCEGALAAGHALRRVQLARLEFPLLRSQQDWEQGTLPPGLQEAQRQIEWAEHLVLIFPLWLGDMPALVKGFLEQIMRPGFAFDYESRRSFARKRLQGRSARIVCTMGMPAAVYRWYFRAHSLRALERNILGFVGIGPVNETLIGSVGQLGEAGGRRWLAKLGKLGREGQ